MTRCLRIVLILITEREVIDHLRSQLEVKTGETIEARDRVSSLEAHSLDTAQMINSKGLELRELVEEGAETRKRLSTLEKGWSESIERAVVLQAELGGKESEISRLLEEKKVVKEQ